ncbi:MAG: DEAD/DEAH box helicase [Gallionella sp.]
MVPSRSYSQADIVRWYSLRDLQKARTYVSAVSNLSFSATEITAQVRGTAPHPYRVRIIFLNNKNPPMTIQAVCSCPMRQDCKHTAAVLLAGLNTASGLPRVSEVVLAWAEMFKESYQPRMPSTPADGLYYFLTLSRGDEEPVITLHKGKLKFKGAYPEGLKPWDLSERVFMKPPQFVREADLAILRLLWRQGRANEGWSLMGESGHTLLTQLLASERFCLAARPFTQPKETPKLLKSGKARTGQLVWQVDATGRRVIQLQSQNAPLVLPLPEATWYVDRATGEVGQLTLAQSPWRVMQLLDMPPLSEPDMPVVAEVLRESVPELPMPGVIKLRRMTGELRPRLTLETVKVPWMDRFRGYSYGPQMVDIASVSMCYGEAILPLNHEGEFFILEQGETVRVVRDFAAEMQRVKSLVQYGLKEMPPSTWVRDVPTHCLHDAAAWQGFMQENLPQLRTAGWEVVMTPDFRHLVLEVESWEADFQATEDGWFNLDMGIVVNGQRLPLAPLLHALFKRESHWLDADQLANMPEEQPVTLQLPEGGRVQVPAGRIKPLARTLIELFDGQSSSDTLPLSRFDVARIAALTDMAHWQFKDQAAVTTLAQQLRQTSGIQAIEPPTGFGIQLRPYQQEGLAWLQYLRAQGLGGILADDMGLGKTAQTLAHLLLEKQSGRMDKPSLVVLPTSLIFNWKQEAARFAPALKMLSLHGKERAAYFDSIPQHDVILTTYPLLWRDEDTLAKYDYHLLILDEAQMVKNVTSQAAQVVRKLNARHRLCLTGTPLENHLGELWAQFDFLLPGLLGNSKTFTKAWRTPIEKQGNVLRRELLAKRIKPFILRRRKEDVARELPEKTVIVRSVELADAQRDLYETVRVAMDERVRTEIASKGLARSHIVLLDALLKLRQVCCDPRLVKLSQAQKVKESAKLTLLMEMLPELVNEGRRVLVFSQFTTMLGFIAEALDKVKLGYVMLTGDTQDRESVVRRFQDGEVPIFLISLKAGGVGLNLTTADTVIHYDPWWNPAAENQASDRAHRLGQQKNVFVYKLVVAGSIEEKILALQEKKAILAAGILSEDTNSMSKFGAEDIAALLAPLPSEE